ncbi:MAG: hypothetical protein HY231_12525 [Acidobacteria bacterium]|nr:hypothetical protein [Acidobacteriota bacterium]
MTTDMKPLAEITQEAIRVLCETIGVANTVRFINQFTNGSGNYTEERRQIFATLSVEEIASVIESQRS